MARKPTKATAKPGAADTPTSGASDTTTGWVTLITGLCVSGFLLWRNVFAHLPMGFHEYNLLNTAFILWIPLIVGMCLLRREPADIGFGVGDLPKGALVALICLVLFSPVIYYFAAQPAPQEYYLGWMRSSGALDNLYPQFAGSNLAGYKGGVINAGGLASHELVMGFYMFGWEYYHRGFLLSGFKKIMPVWGAVLAQAVLFTALHLGKPLAETASSFPGAILMALLAIRYRSFLPCFLLHWFVSAGFDFAVLYHHFH